MMFGIFKKDTAIRRQMVEDAMRIKALVLKNSYPSGDLELTPWTDNTWGDSDV